MKTGKIVKEKDGGYSISGTVDKGNEGIKKFKCRFDKDRRSNDGVIVQLSVGIFPRHQRSKSTWCAWSIYRSLEVRDAWTFSPRDHKLRLEIEDVLE